MSRKTRYILLSLLIGALCAAACDDEDELDDVDTSQPRIDADDVVDGPDADVGSGLETDSDDRDVPSGPPVQAVDCAAVDPDVTIRMVDFLFDPDSETIEVGDIVRWVNEGDVAHTTTSGSPGGESGELWDSGSVEPGEDYCARFRTPASYDYFCTIHPIRMQATLTIQ